MANLSHLIEVVKNEDLGLNEDRRADVLQILNETMEGVEYLASIADGLRRYTKADSTDVTLVDLQHVLELAVKMTVGSTRHRAKVALFITEAPPVIANENRLVQVIVNLLLNAAHAIPVGDGHRHEIGLSLRTHGKNVEVEVRDTGSGIKPEHLPHIFEPFYTTREEGKGTGIGLSICREIVTSFGGWIDVQTEVGLGSIFTVVLPIPSRRSRSSKSLRARADAPHRARVLLIDDDALIRDALKRILGTDHDVTSVGDASEALAFLREGRRYDVIFCDLSMPGMSGIEFLDAVAKEFLFLTDRIVFLTGGPTSEGAKRFLDSIPNRWFSKPFDTTDLRSFIDTMAR